VNKSRLVLLMVGVVFLITGCSAIQIKSDSGSFRRSLKSEYYEKANYKELLIGYTYVEGMLNNVDIDEVIDHGLVAVYCSHSIGAKYSKLNEYGMKPGLDKDKLEIYFRQIYESTKGRGYEITIRERMQGTILKFVTYQEIHSNKKGDYVIRCNVPKREAIQKEEEWENRLNLNLL